MKAVISSFNTLAQSIAEMAECNADNPNVQRLLKLANHLSGELATEAEPLIAFAKNVKEMRRNQDGYVKNIRAKKYVAASEYGKSVTLFQNEVDVRCQEIITGCRPIKLF